MGFAAVDDASAREHLSRLLPGNCISGDLSTTRDALGERSCRTPRYFSAFTSVRFDEKVPCASPLLKDQTIQKLPSRFPYEPEWCDDFRERCALAPAYPPRRRAWAEDDHAAPILDIESRVYARINPSMNCERALWVKSFATSSGSALARLKNGNSRRKVIDSCRISHGTAQIRLFKGGYARRHLLRPLQATRRRQSSFCECRPAPPRAFRHRGLISKCAGRSFRPPESALHRAICPIRKRRPPWTLRAGGLSAFVKNALASRRRPRNTEVNPR